MKYELYVWYCWDFGRWNFVKEFKTKEELQQYIQIHKINTYAVKQGSTVMMSKIRAGGWRYGMSQPRLPINPNRLCKPS